MHSSLTCVRRYAESVRYAQYGVQLENELRFFALK